MAERFEPTFVRIGGVGEGLRRHDELLEGEPSEARRAYRLPGPRPLRVLSLAQVHFAERPNVTNLFGAVNHPMAIRAEHSKIHLRI